MTLQTPEDNNMELKLGDIQTTALIALGAAGIITPATSAMLHNLSTIGISLYNMTDLMEN